MVVGVVLGIWLYSRISFRNRSFRMKFKIQSPVHFWSWNLERTIFRITKVLGYFIRFQIIIRGFADFKWFRRISRVWKNYLSTILERVFIFSRDFTIFSRTSRNWFRFSEILQDFKRCRMISTYFDGVEVIKNDSKGF